MSEPLYRIVNGQRVRFSPEEEASIRAEWASFVPEQSRRTISALDFLQRLTPDERIAIREAARANAGLEDWLDMLRAAQWVDLDDARTISGLNSMVNAGLLTAARRDEILA